jgi:hypothetical protein
MIKAWMVDVHCRLFHPTATELVAAGQAVIVVQNVLIDDFTKACANGTTGSTAEKTTNNGCSNATVGMSWRDD